MKRVMVGRHQMAVRVGGQGQPVLLVHGIPGSSRAWDAVVELIVGAGYRAIVPDLLGFGESSRPGDLDGLLLPSQAAALNRVLADLAEVPAIVVGHDYGAPISVVLARTHPARVKGLVLASGNLFTDTPIPGPLKLLAIPAVGSIAAAVLMSGPALRGMLHFGRGDRTAKLAVSAYLGDVDQQASIRRIFRAALSDLAGRYAEVEAALPMLSAPTAVLWGDRDPFFPIREGRRAAAAIRGAELFTAKGAGHFLPAERPQLFLDALARVAGLVGATSEERVT